jgi:SH3-like domain-containing protein
MKRAGALISIGFLALAACQTPTPTTPVAKATATSRPIVAAATPTAIPPSPTTAPTDTSTPAAASTPAPTLDATTPSPTATATVAPTATPTPAPTPAAREVFVNGDAVNFRDTPGTTGNVLQVLTQGTHLIAIDQPTAPDAGGIAWQNVRTDDGRSGWVAAQLLSAVTSSPTPPPPPAPSGTPSADPTVTPIEQAGYVYVISVDGLNLRADHTASSNIIAQLANGQRLQTNGLGLGPDDQGLKWLNVKTADGTLGWVAADYVSTEVPSVEPAQQPTNEAAIANELLRRTNALRQQNSLPPYAVDPGLAMLALAHSEYMSQNGLTHNDTEGRSATKRQKRARQSRR